MRVCVCVCDLYGYVHVYGKHAVPLTVPFVNVAASQSGAFYSPQLQPIQETGSHLILIHELAPGANKYMAQGSVPGSGLVGRG